LIWRYIDHPRFNYQVKVLVDTATDVVVGGAVFRVETIRGRTEKILRVLEFLSIPDSEKQLAQCIFQAGISHGVVFVDFYCTSTVPSDGLRSIGMGLFDSAAEKIRIPSRFQPLQPERVHLVGGFYLSKSLRTKVGKLHGLSDFYITKSDGDQDRPN
jgi:hypothetical protein